MSSVPGTRRKTFQSRATSSFAARAGLLGATTLLLGAVLSVVVLGGPSAEAQRPTVTSVSASGIHTCARTSTGGVECWGYNFSGQLGNGTTIDSSVPVAVSGLSSGVSTISAGGVHTCALTTGGGVECWGNNADGELGNGTTIDSSVPVAVSGLSSGVSAISAGGVDTCALTRGGGVECWGDNANGELGNGTTTDSSVPVAVSGLSSGVSAISAGGVHTCALTRGGGVECWGYNADGELGNGTTTDSSVPVAVSGLSSGVSTISAGDYGDDEDTSALTSIGGLECWGYNGAGQLGNGTTTSSSVPEAVSGLSSGVSAISAGAYTTSAITSGRGAECWGGNSNGELGNGTTTSSSVPVAVSGLSSGVSTISVGTFHTCALTSAGGVQCWGGNGYGQLGDGTSTGPQSCEGSAACSKTPVAALVETFDTVTFNNEGGSTVAPIVNLDGSTVTLPGAPSLPGYAFTGWNTASDGSGSNYSAGANYTLSGSVTLYAQWKSPESTTVLLPSSGATVSGSRYLDASASGATGVEFLLFGGTYGFDAPVICTATETEYGWLCDWDTTTVANGSYTLVSEASSSNGDAYSSGVGITVKNPLPTTSILLPSIGATLVGSTYLDASASNATSVEFRLFGGIYGYGAPVVCTATLTDYGWLCSWNTSTVPDGSYVLVSEAFNSAGSAFGSGVSITVNN